MKKKQARKKNQNKKKVKSTNTAVFEKVQKSLSR